MNSELDSKLVERYPKLYRDRGAPITHTAMCWGFQCGDGWYKLIDTLSYFLDMSGEDITVSTVKEKFGILRFYIYGGSEYTNDLIHMIEIASEHTCEQCGAWSELRGKSWVYNMCDKCWKKFQEERDGIAKSDTNS